MKRKLLRNSMKWKYRHAEDNLDKVFVLAFNLVSLAACGDVVKLFTYPLACFRDSDTFTSHRIYTVRPIASIRRQRQCQYSLWMICTVGGTDKIPPDKIPPPGLW